ncbi:uncharacterized protein LOC144142378 isoform X2 [Haemaphysalis longicornis]
MTTRTTGLARSCGVFSSGETQASVSTANIGTQCSVRLLASTESQTEVFPDTELDTLWRDISSETCGELAAPWNDASNSADAPVEQPQEQSCACGMGDPGTHNKATLASCRACRLNNHQSSRVTTDDPVQADKVSCKICKKDLPFPASPIDRLRTHAGERPYACRFCHECFSLESYLHWHERLHGRENSPVCAVCQEDIIQKGSLHINEKLHAGKKPHECDAIRSKAVQVPCERNLVLHKRVRTG